MRFYIDLKEEKQHLKIPDKLIASSEWAKQVFEQNGIKVNANKFYIKPLTDEPNCEIGLVTGISSPLHKHVEFIKPNTIDSNKDTPAWSNKENDSSLDILLNQIKSYLNRQDS